MKSATEDVERGSSSSLPDPFLFRDAFKTTPQLAELRQRRKTGKRLEKYHRRQNNVRPHWLNWIHTSCRPDFLSSQLIVSLLKPMEEHTQDAKVEEEAARFSVSFFFCPYLVGH